MMDISNIVGNKKSVKSIHPCKSPPEWLSRAGVIQTMYNIVKVQAIEMFLKSPLEKVETKVDEGKPDNLVKTDGRILSLTYLYNR
jgi:hypothetical protein